MYDPWTERERPSTEWERLSRWIVAAVMVVIALVFVGEMVGHGCNYDEHGVDGCSIFDRGDD